uniref:Uncharacterized protein n=1 Tax=Setaria italica TaxID=4555 RepID=K3Y4G8_SETIT
MVISAGVSTSTGKSSVLFSALLFGSTMNFTLSSSSFRPGHSVLTEPIGSVPRFLHNSGS